RVQWPEVGRAPVGVDVADVPRSRRRVVLAQAEVGVGGGAARLQPGDLVGSVERRLQHDLLEGRQGLEPALTVVERDGRPVGAADARRGADGLRPRHTSPTPRAPKRRARTSAPNRARWPRSRRPPPATPPRRNAPSRRHAPRSRLRSRRAPRAYAPSRAPGSLLLSRR